MNLSVLGLDRAATVLIVLVLGGYGRLYGAFVGAVAYMVLAHFLSKAYPTAWQLGLGLLLVVIALFARNGILGIFEELWQRCRARKRRRSHDRAAGNALAQQNFGALRATRDVTFTAGGRRAPRADRPERRRQDHLHQPADRRADAERRRRCCSRAATSRKVEQAERVKLGIARTFQINRLFRGLSVLENVYMAIAERVGAAPDMVTPAGSRRDVIDEAMELLTRLKLADIAHKTIPELPYGRQRLVELAITLALKPEVLLLDEPAAGVPSAESHIILDAIDALPKHIGVLIIDHDMDLVFRFAKHITVLVRGAVFARGHAEGDRRQPDVRAVYLGQAMAWLAPSELRRLGGLRRDRGDRGHRSQTCARRMHQRDRPERRRQDDAAVDHHGPHHACTRAR